MVEVVGFEIDQAAEPEAQVVVKRAPRQRAVQLVEKVLGPERSRREGEEPEGDPSERFHANSTDVTAAGFITRNRASNLVHTSSD